MLAHPLILAIFFLDIAVALSLAYTAWVAVQVTAEWRPSSSDRRQLRLERRFESAALSLKGGIAVFFFSTVLYLTAIASILPGLVQGAMCGTGVVQAMGVAGDRAVALRLLSLILAHMLGVSYRLDAQKEIAPLAQLNARLTLLVLPVILLALLDTAKSVLAIDPTVPVSCCAELLDTLKVENSILETLFAKPTLTLGALVSGITLVSLVIAVGIGRRYRPLPLLSLVFVAFTFVFFGTYGLIRVFSNYHYQVLSHHCAWCLFIPEHHFVGYPLFFSLLLISTEAGALLIAFLAAAKENTLKVASEARMGRALIAIALGLAVYAAFAALPAISWRLRFGTWLN